MMKNIAFYKYQGNGNDFILFDNRNNSLPPYQQKTYKKLCDRRWGIGADGIIVLKKHSKYDFEMLYYNADGKISSMCGNGARCIVSFANFLKIMKNSENQYNFIASDGKHTASIDAHGIVTLSMNDVNKIKVNKAGDYILNTGSPHYVKIVTDITKINVKKEGKKIRDSSIYRKAGINVNFVQINEKEISVRTYERGVEDETLSCGTGVTAAAICSLFHRPYFTEHNVIDVKTTGGDFKVRVSYNGKSFTSIYLIGDTLQVFQGAIKL